MNLGRKKVIAREFLVLLGCGLISLLVLIGSSGYNGFLKTQISNLKDSVELITYRPTAIEKDSIEGNENFRLLYESIKEELSSKTLEEFRNKLLKDPSKQVTLHATLLKKFGNIPHDFIVFRNDFGLIQKMDFDKIKNIESHIKSISYRKLDPRELAVYWLIGVSVFAFPFRYFLYSVLWSISVLKQKE